MLRRTYVPWLAALCLVPVAAAQFPPFEVIDYPGASATLAFGINDDGDVVGHYRDGQQLWRGFLLRAGEFTTIEYPGAAQTTLFRVNSGGDIAGAYYDGSRKQHGFLLSHGRYATTDVPGAGQPMVYGLNSRGDVTGMYFAPGDSLKHFGFVMAGGRFTTIDFPSPNDMSCGTWIGDSGEVAGHVREANGAYHGYRWTDGRFTLVELPGGEQGQFWDSLYEITAAGDLLGTYSDPQGRQRAFLMRDGAVTTFDVPGARRTRATSMNRSGQVVGMFVDGDGVTHGFRTRMAPPPAP